MRLLCKLMIGIPLAAVSLCGAFAQSGAFAQNSPATQNGMATGNPALVQAADKKSIIKSHIPPRQLTKKERKALLAIALDGRAPQEHERDCSHLVHAIYETAGFPYEYAPSDDLYAGVERFQRVKKPQAGDLVVWRGHVGIVIKPSKHSFFSSLSSGPGTEDYKSPYWKRRGPPRFYRYIKREAVRGATKLNEPIR